MLGKITFIIINISLIYLTSFTTGQTVSSVANIRCDYQNVLNKVSELDCTSQSDPVYACCHLYADLADNTGFTNQLCMPFSVQATPYSSIMIIAGLAFKVKCPTPLPAASNPVQLIRGSSCGPSVTYGYKDCSVYSTDHNSCCLARYPLDSDPNKNIDTCVFYGQKFDQNAYKSTLALTSNFTIPNIGKMIMICRGYFLNYTSLVISLIMLLILVF